MPCRSKPRVWIALVSLSFLSACYEGIDPDLYAEEFGDEYGVTGESGGEEFGDGATTGFDTGESGATDGGDTGTTGDGDTSTTTGDGDTSTSTTTGDGDTDTTTTTTGDGDTSTTTTTGDGDTSTTTTTGDGDTTTTGGGDPYEMPNNPYCNPVADWDPDWLDRELEVLDLVNMARAQGGNCGSEGNFPASGPLTWEPALSCAARVHSLDMAENNYFSHTNLEGNGPGWRLNQAGYNGGGWGENIAAGYGDPQQVVQGWLDSDGHCANMLNPGFSEIGIGYAYGPGQYGHYWTQTFGG